MKWHIKESEDLKNKIIENEELMRDLGNSVEKILKKFKIEFTKMSYIFEPRIFTLEPDEVPELLLKSREAMRLANLEEAYKNAREFLHYPQLICWEECQIECMRICHIECRRIWCLPYCGIPDPLVLSELEKLRIPVESSPRGDIIIDTSEKFMKQIIGNKELLAELSNSIYGILTKNGITFRNNEGCVFTPVVFEAPNYAQKITLPKEIQPNRSFGPQIYATPINLPKEFRPTPIPGVIVSEKFPRPIPGVILDHWWWIGIPAPEMLRALDILRDMKSI